MSVEAASTVQCEASPTGRHQWECITVQSGEIVGADSTGAPIFIPDIIVGCEIDSPCLPQSAYGCGHCNEPWDEALTTT